MPPEDTNDQADLGDVQIAVPTMGDGAGMWQVARDTGSLDLNSSYAYLIFCRDFSRTCRIATAGSQVVGFVLGYRRPEDPSCLFVWQIAVDSTWRGRGISGRLLDGLLQADPPQALETTITADNTASQALFASLARRWGAELTHSPFLEPEHFPDSHEAEALYRIAPLQPGLGRS